MATSIHATFVYRQLLRPRKQTVLFLCCVALALVTLVALGGFDLGVKKSVWKDARALHGGDLIVRSRVPFSVPLSDAIENLEATHNLTVARTWEFYTVARNNAENASVLAAVKVVEPNYPLYGEVDLKSGARFQDRLRPGTVIVEQGLMDRLDLAPGASLRVGDAELTISDVVVREPDRPVNVFSMGPRVFVDSEDLGTLNLLGKGSRVRYIALLRVPEEEKIPSLLSSLEQIALDREERVESYRTAESRLQRFLDNFLFFLTLIGVFTLVLAGIGIQVSLSAYFREQEKSIAVMKALGATHRFIRRQFLAVVFGLGIAGSVIGIACGLLLQSAMPGLFRGLLPGDLTFAVSWQAIGEGLLMGVLLTALFALLPLQRLGAVKPSAVFRKELPMVPGFRTFGLPVAGIGFTIAALILWRTQDVKTAGIMMGGGLGAMAAIALMTTALLTVIRRWTIRRLSLRQALRGLYRPRNATRSIIVTLTASLSLTAAIYLVQKNLEAAFIQSFPPDAPNVFLIDIQSDQKTAVARMAGPGAILHPNIRSRLLSINGVSIDPKEERRRKSDNLARPFNLTYREFLLEDERLKSGDALFQDRLGRNQVSVLDNIADIGNIEIGDRLRFRVQGVPLEVTVSSIRTRIKEGLNPYFYFVFPEETLLKAPQTLFTGLRMDPSEIAGFQNRVVSSFPNVSVIDVTRTIETFGNVLGRLSKIIRFFTGFGITAGILLIISSIIATRGARVREAVYFRVLGAKKNFVTRVFFLEHAMIGVLSALQAVGIAELIAWFVCTRQFDVPYHPYLFFGGGLTVATLALVTIVGLAASRSILNQKPMIVLKSHLQE